MSNPFSWYARFPRDYAEATAHLSLAEHGAYTLLLDHYMTAGKPIANAIGLPSVCYRICRAQSDDERTAVDSVVAQFFTVEDDGCLHNKRADIELDKRTNVIESRASAGKLGAQARWKAKEGMANAMANAMPEPLANAMANDMAKGMAKRCTSTSTSTKEEKKEKASDLELPSNLNRQAWDEWIAYRRERRLPVGVTALRKHLKALAPFDTATQQGMIDAAIGSSWRSLYAPKGVAPAPVGKPPMPPVMVNGVFNPEHKAWAEKWA